MHTSTSHISKKFISGLTTHLPGVLFCANNDEHFSLSYISENCVKLTGYTQHELLEDGLLFMIDQHDHRSIKEKKDLAFSTNNSCQLEYRITTKDGKTKWVHEIVSPVLNEFGIIVHTEGYLREMHEKYEYSTFAKTFHALQNAVNKSSIVTICNKQGAISYANELFCETMEYSAKEIIGQDHRMITSGIHSSDFFKDLWETILSGEIWRGEICNRSKTGNLLWFDTVITPLFDKNNHVVQFLAIRNDITDKKVFEKAIKKSEERLRKVFEGVNDMIFTLCPNGNILTLNHAFETITGWKTTEWIGRPLNELMDPGNIQSTSNVLQYLTEKQEAPFFETRIITRSGNTVHIEITPSSLSDNGKIIGILGIARDVTFRVQSELKLKQIHESISVKTGMNYFSNLTKYCRDQFEVKYACIGLFNEEDDTLQMLSFRNLNNNYAGHILKIKDTPYEKVINHEVFVFVKDLKDKFPNDTFLKKNSIESFIGYPLKDENEKVLGVIALMDTKPISDISTEENFIDYILSRTCNEVSRYITEKKLKESEAFNNGILTSLDSHIAVIDEKGKIISVNDAWNDFYNENGATTMNRSSLGSNYFEVCERAIRSGDEFAKNALDGIKAVLTKKERIFQMVYPCHSGTIKRWFLMSVTCFEDEKPKGVIRHLDITERRNFETLIEKNEKNYSQLVENSKEFIFSLDANSKFTFANNYMRKALNLTSQELSELSIFDIVQIEYRSECIKHFKEILNGNNESGIELAFRTNRKKKIYVEGNSTPIINESQIIGIQCFFRDVTARKKIEMDLTKSERRYKNVVENINDAIAVRTLEGTIVFANQQFYDLFGKSEAELESINAGDHIAAGWQVEVRKLYTNFLSEKNALDTYVYQGIHKSGSLIWLEDSVSLLFEDGEIIGTQSVMRDITEVKKKENELKKLIQELTNRNNEMMQFNYIVSHNLRAPIANIIGLSNIIGNENITFEEQEQIIQHIRSSSLKIDEIIKDLSLVLNTRTNLNAKKEKINFKKIVRSILGILEEQISTSQCKLSVEIGPDANELFSIKSYMESILYNLISNAIKYRSPQRNLKVDLKIVKVRDHMRITVKDNGIGINLAENGDYMFGLYKRFNYEVEGKGLGLHMTKTQVESLNGKINVTSEVNKGSIFTIDLPISASIAL